jgi:hypothetical protein
VWLGQFLHAFLNEAQQGKAGEEQVSLPALNQVSRATLQLLFRILWRWQGWPEQETLVVTLQQEKPRYYRLEVAAHNLHSFAEIALPANIEKSLALNVDVDIDLLADAAKQSKAALLLALLRGEGCRLGRGTWAWQSACQKIRVSPASLELVGRWFFPFSGIGLLFWCGEEAVPWIFYGGVPPTLQLKEKISHPVHSQETHGLSQPLLQGAQEFRHQYHLAAALSLDLAALRAAIAKNPGLLGFLAAYGHSWAVSVPLEINDFLLHLPHFWQLLPLQETFRACHLDRSHLLSLCQLYCENGLKYLKKTPIYLAIKDNESRLLLELTNEGIFETDTCKKVPAENLFTLDIEIFSTLMSWVNDTSLRLMARFAEAILPAEVAEKIEREECLVWLNLEETGGGTAHLFLCGGNHDLPGDWQGDFSATLMCPRTKRILFQELLTEASLAVRDEFPDYRLECPPESILKGMVFHFRAGIRQTMARGFARIVSATSILSEVAPGLRTTLAFAGYISGGSGELSLANRHYRIHDGVLLCSVTSGRIMKGRHFVQHISHHWLCKNDGGLAVSGICTEQQRNRWQEWIAHSEQGVVVVDACKTFTAGTDDSFLPHPGQAGEIIGPSPSVGWREKHTTFVKFWILHAWAVPLDMHGNYLLRVRAVAMAGRQPGFALLEFPCRLPGILEKQISFPVAVHNIRNGVAFTIGSMEILRVKGARYVRTLRPGWSWRWH